MFLHLSVILFTGGVSQHASQVTWQTPPGQTPPPSRMVNEQAVRILLECILVALDFAQFCLCGSHVQVIERNILTKNKGFKIVHQPSPNSLGR